jgi:predicted dehydrogenase
MNKTINWGIIAPGGIAHKFASDMKLVSGSVLKAVASRDISRSKDFAAQYSAEKAYGSYEELVNDPEVEVVYIASPHTFHYEHTMLCLENGKHVLCEKPIGMNSIQLQKMIDKAREKNLFLMEAFWTRFIPSYLKFRELVENKFIGELKYIQADFGFSVNNDPNNRWLNKELGGGALLDIGIYPIFLALDIAGEPDEISSKAFIGKTGVDENCCITLKYSKSQVLANLNSTIVGQTPVEALACGTKGYVKLNRMFHIPTSVECLINEKNETFNFEEKGFGYEYEIEEVNSCLRKGKTQSELFSLDSSLRLHRTLDSIRKQINLQYEADTI